TLAGLKACKNLRSEGIMVNVTLCFTPNQALLAAQVGATFISPFLGRLDDINLDGMELIGQIRQIYDNYAFSTEILAASPRSPTHVTQAARASADGASRAPAVIRKLADHARTGIGLANFVKDWEATGQSIVEPMSDAALAARVKAALATVE